MSSLERWLTLLTLIAAALAALLYVIRILWAGFRIMERVHTLVEHELTPNGGSSMRDDVAGIAVAVGGLQADLEELKRAKALAHELLQLQLDTLAGELAARHKKGTT